MLVAALSVPPAIGPVAPLISSTIAMSGFSCNSDALTEQQICCSGIDAAAQLQNMPSGQPRSQSAVSFAPFSVCTVIETILLMGGRGCIKDTDTNLGSWPADYDVQPLLFCLKVWNVELEMPLQGMCRKKNPRSGRRVACESIINMD